MKLYRDMNEQERRASDQLLSFSMEKQKLAAEARMAIWDDLTAEERKKYQEETNVCG